MPSLIQGFEYDIFISYRQNDNRSGWVTEFVKALEEELAAAIKEPVSVYFDTNPHDGLLETHVVEDSLKVKLKCAIFLPILSQTYYDPKGYAWTNEFLTFIKQNQESGGLKVKLANGNVAHRVLPVRIHELDPGDKAAVENEIGPLRAVDFVYASAGVNRPLTPHDKKEDNTNRLQYRDQVNKVSNAVKEIIAGMKNPGQSSSQASEQLKGNRNVKWPFKKILTIASVLAVVVLAGYFLYTKRLTSDAPVLDKSIAVLPFVNMSNDPAQEYFSDGITEEILNTLVKIRDLKVMGRTSSFQYKGKNEDLKTIGESLGVSYILEGSVRRTQTELRITAQLINAETGFHLWSEEYSGSVDDVFRVQEKVSVDIARALSDRLGVSGLSAQKARDVNPVAYDYYLKGRQQFMKRENIDESTRLFRLAIRSDSTFDLAYSSLAASLVLTPFFHQGEDFAKWYDEADLQARKALRLDSVNAEAYSVLGIINNNRRNYLEAHTYYEHALRINPGSSTANLWFGQHLYHVGRFTESLEYIERATRLEPLYAVNHRWSSQIESYLGNWESAIAHAKRADVMGFGGDLAGWTTIFAYADSEKWGELENFIRQRSEVSAELRDRLLAWVAALRNKDKRLYDSLRREAKPLNKYEEVLASHWLYRIGRFDEVMGTFEGYEYLSHALVPSRKPLRSLPIFKQTVRKFRLMDYWKKYGGPDACPNIREPDLICD